MNLARAAPHPELFAPARDRFGFNCTVALLLTAGFAAYISWVPFNFTAPSIDTLGDTMRAALVPSVISRANLIANAILFIPFGLFGGGAFGLESRAQSRAWRAALLLFTSLLLSAAIEGLQILLPGRTPASSDVMAQAGGTALGLAAWLLVGAEARVWVASRRQPVDPVVLLLHAAVGCLVVGALFPLDVTVSLSTLAQKYRNGGILLVPFEHQELQDGLVPDIVSNMLFAMPLGAWCLLAWTSDGRRRRIVPAILAATLFLTWLEACQVVVVSRVADVTDIVTGAIGASIGAWVAAARASARPRSGGRSMLPLIGVAASIALYTLLNWSPFDFRLSRALLETRWPELIQVPFQNYYAHSELQAIGDFAFKFCIAVPIGVFSGLAKSGGRKTQRLFLVVSSIVAGALFFGIELGQIFLPSRFPDVTDVLIGTLGFGSGVAMSGMLRSGRLDPAASVTAKTRRIFPD
jgi:glycopeptide antibiotics resistance protein